MISYVRVKGDENVYEVNGFLEFTFNQQTDYFRNGTLVNDDFNNWESLTFSYPADSSFRLVRDTSGNWMINNIKTDSSQTINFLRTLSRLNGNDFIDNPDPFLLDQADYRLKIESPTMRINLSAYRDSSQIIIRSSQNQEAYFNGITNSLWQKIFVGKDYFLGK
jgi:hypothetical protein